MSVLLFLATNPADYSSVGIENINGEKFVNRLELSNAQTLRWLSRIPNFENCRSK